MGLNLKKIDKLTPDLHLQKVLCELRNFETVEGIVYVSKENHMCTYYLFQDSVGGSSPPEFINIRDRSEREYMMKIEYGYKHSLYIALAYRDIPYSLDGNSYVKEMFYLNSSVKSKIIEVWN